MRRFARRFGLCVFLTLCAASPLVAADLRIGYIDSSRIFLEYKDAQESQQRFV